MIKSLRTQMYALTVIPLIIIAVTSVLLLVSSFNKFGLAVASTTEKAVFSAEQHRLKSLMASVENVIKPYVDMPGDSGKTEALSLLKNFIYDDGVGYVFGYSYDGVRLLLGQNDATVGKNYWDLQDKNDQFLIRDLADLSKGDEGGFYTYFFPKPNENEASAKYAFVIGIDKWNMFLGTGLYFDSIDGVLAEIEDSLLVEKFASLKSSLFVSLVILSLTALVGTFAVRGVLGGLIKLSESVFGLAEGQGDLTVSLPPRGIDELDTISLNFNRYIELLAGDISILKSTSSKLTSMATSVNSEQQGLTDEVGRQRENTLQVASAVEEMSSTAKEIAANAENTSNIANSVNSEINQVLDQVNQSNKRIDQLSTVLTDVDESVQELGNNVGSINSVLDVIQSISEQTNLLALNAAIEAARAGEQGRGFAVVADEVRSLAQRSQQSTIEISEILDKLKISSDRSVANMATTGKSRADVNQAMEVIKGLVESTTSSIGSLLDMNTMVATAASEQSTVASQISKSVNEIASSAEKIGESSEMVQSQFSTVNELASEVDSVSNKFIV